MAAKQPKENWGPTFLMKKTSVWFRLKKCKQSFYKVEKFRKTKVENMPMYSWLVIKGELTSEICRNQTDRF
jgi:hypothetical protein